MKFTFGIIMGFIVGSICTFIFLLHAGEIYTYLTLL